MYTVGEKIATREAYGKALAEFGATYDFAVLDADLAEATKTLYFKKAYPDRFIDCGIAEGNMIGIAAGIEGYMLKEMNPVQRILSVLGGLMLIYPGTITDVCGVLVVVLVGVWQQLQKRKAAAV